MHVGEKSADATDISQVHHVIMKAGGDNALLELLEAGHVAGLCVSDDEQ